MKLQFFTHANDAAITKAIRKGKATKEEQEVYVARKAAMNQKFQENGYSLRRRNNPYSLVGSNFSVTKEVLDKVEKDSETQRVNDMFDEVFRTIQP